MSGGSVEVLGIRVDRLTMREAVDRAIRLACENPGSLAVTPNAELVWAAQGDPELRRALNAARLAVADGAGVVWASRLLGRPVPERVAGYDLMRELLAGAARRDLSVFFLGGRPGVADRAARRAVELHRGLRVAGTAHGYFSPAEEPGLREAVRRASADFLFAGLGAPRQEKWLARNLARLGVGLAMGVGGSLDVLAGSSRRAPAWMIGANLEWLYRLVNEPKRLGRQLALPRFILAVVGRRLGLGGDGDDS
ncbi:MAG: WecB/TagA/CpsF family glycosyltransferase [bacterium]|nr:WecB/TagA/CpsF family glycosyltransferase [bacterium]